MTEELLFPGRSTDNLSTLSMVFIMVGVVKGVFICFALIAVCFRFEPSRLYVCVCSCPRQCALEYAFVCKCAVSVYNCVWFFVLVDFRLSFAKINFLVLIKISVVFQNVKLIGVFCSIISYGLFNF